MVRAVVTRVLEMAFILALIYLLMNVQGCNTVNGFGRDLQTVSRDYVE